MQTIMMVVLMRTMMTMTMILILYLNHSGSVILMISLYVCLFLCLFVVVVVNNTNNNMIYCTGHNSAERKLNTDYKGSPFLSTHPTTTHSPIGLGRNRKKKNVKGIGRVKQHLLNGISFRKCVGKLKGCGAGSCRNGKKGNLKSEWQFVWVSQEITSFSKPHQFSKAVAHAYACTTCTHACRHLCCTFLCSFISLLLQKHTTTKQFFWDSIHNFLESVKNVGKISIVRSFCETPKGIYHLLLLLLSL